MRTLRQRQKVASGAVHKNVQLLAERLLEKRHQSRGILLRGDSIGEDSVVHGLPCARHHVRETHRRTDVGGGASDLSVVPLATQLRDSTVHNRGATAANNSVRTVGHCAAVEERERQCHLVRPPFCRVAHAPSWRVISSPMPELPPVTSAKIGRAHV